MLTILGIFALTLTCAMFIKRESLLGSPSGMFWGILGGHAYTLSTAEWDIYYFMFFASMGMLIFCIFAAFILKTKKQEIEEGEEFIDEGKDDLQFIDEGNAKEKYDEYGNPRHVKKAQPEEEKVSGVRWRANERRKRYGG